MTWIRYSYLGEPEDVHDLRPTTHERRIEDQVSDGQQHRTALHCIVAGPAALPLSAHGWKCKSTSRCMLMPY